MNWLAQVTALANLLFLVGSRLTKQVNLNLFMKDVLNDLFFVNKKNQQEKVDISENDKAIKVDEPADDSTLNSGQQVAAKPFDGPAEESKMRKIVPIG